MSKHFQRFNEKIKAFGTDKMAQEVHTLRQKLAATRDECVQVSTGMIHEISP